MGNNCLGRWDFEVSALVAAWPVRFSHDHKARLYALATEAGPLSGQLRVSRWAAADLPAVAPDEAPRARLSADYFKYDENSEDEVHWYLNFADPELFGFFEGALFAQDEMQVAEHPALCHLRQALRAAGAARTEEGGQPTPVLVAGVERRLAVETAPDAAAGRPAGLYGNRFGRAPWAAVAAATRAIVPPTRSNLLAIAAPGYGRGAYTAAQIQAVLVTAFTGFQAVREESARAWPGARVVLHTGYWGGGAFGGDRELLTLLQLHAARLAALDAVVVHVGDLASAGPADEAMRIGPLPAETPAALAAVLARGYRWGQSDGN